MSIAGRDAAGRRHQGLAAAVERLVEFGRRYVADTCEGTIVLTVLVAFVAVWMVFWTISTASVDIHVDNDEALLWAKHFAFGYKHPPMTGWLFIAWFSIFPRQQWAVDLLNVTNCAVALGIAWRLLRDHLDKDRALLGLIALILIPLYEVKAEVLNANTVMMPFWAATLLFYLRARRGLGTLDSLLAGAFASCTMLGKYWAVFLFAGMAAAALIGPGTRRFWRSPAPYVMAAGATVVLAPHMWWLVSQHGGGAIQFAESVANQASFGAALKLSLYYIFGAIAYIVVPLIFLAALRPSKAALADIAWPADAERRQAWILLIVPLVLPALVNLIIPYRLTPDWTFPNWALLPVVLYGARGLVVDDRAVARAGVFALVVVAAIVIATPVIAAFRITYGPDHFRPHFRHVAELAQNLAGKPIEFVWGSEDIIDGLFYYLPDAQRFNPDPLSPEGRADSSAHQLVVICLSEDAGCHKTADALTEAGARTTIATSTRRFLGVSSRPLSFQITVVPQAKPPARTTD